MKNPLVKNANTPKDFFMWLGIIATLYVSTISVLILLFEYISILFPDPLDDFYYHDPYSGAIRFGIAALIVLFPMYLFLTRQVNQDIRKHSEKQDIWVRRWALYLTLFIGGVTLAITAITLINVFLGGEATTQFVLKILSLFVVIGAILDYYWFDLKGHWRRNESKSKIFGGVVTAFVIATIVGGFFVMGSPAEQRQYRLDDDRVSHLSNISWEILEHYRTTGEVPATIEELENDFSYFEAPVDPETGEPYEYEKKGALSFTLCAEFARESREDLNDTTYRPKYGFDIGNWEHDAGYVCFERDIDPELYPVYEN